jgi:hypothetical protein
MHHHFDHSLLYDQLSFCFAADLCDQLRSRGIASSLASPGTLLPENNGEDLLAIFGGTTGVLVDIRQGFCQAKDLSEAGAHESVGRGGQLDELGCGGLKNPVKQGCRGGRGRSAQLIAMLFGVGQELVRMRGGDSDCFIVVGEPADQAGYVLSCRPEILGLALVSDADQPLLELATNHAADRIASAVGAELSESGPPLLRIADRIRRVDLA